MKARQGFGEDYECKMNWPQDIFVQCGGKGIVISRQKDMPSYKTAFFEAFPNNPSTFIRGEGASIEEAEESAFKKYEKIMNCQGHEYKRRGNSEHATCMHCHLFTSFCLPPETSCEICKKENINHGFNNMFLCEKHFLEKVEVEYDNLKNSNLNNPKSKDEDDYLDDMEKRAFEMTIENGIFIKLMKKNNLINKNIYEYQEKNRLDKEQTEFEKFCHNKVIEIFKEINKNLSESDKYKLTIIKMSKILDKLFMDEDLYESLIKDFYNIEKMVSGNVLKDYCLNFYK